MSPGTLECMRGCIDPAEEIKDAAGGFTFYGDLLPISWSNHDFHQLESSKRKDGSLFAFHHLHLSLLGCLASTILSTGIKQVDLGLRRFMDGISWHMQQLRVPCKPCKWSILFALYASTLFPTGNTVLHHGICEGT